MPVRRHTRGPRGGQFARGGGLTVARSGRPNRKSPALPIPRARAPKKAPYKWPPMTPSGNPDMVGREAAGMADWYSAKGDARTAAAWKRAAARKPTRLKAPRPNRFRRPRSAR